MKKECMIEGWIARKLIPCFTFLVIITLSNYLFAFSWQDSAYLNIKINNDTTTELQNEEQIVINPRDSSNLVAVWRDFRLGYRQVGYGCSFDGGLTWEQGLFVGSPYEWDSDPGLTVDTAGNFYAVFISFDSTGEQNGIFVFKSSDGGATWSDPMTVIIAAPGVFEDKELIACDRSGGPYTDNLYVAWTRFGPRQILMCRSTDGGNSFENPVFVSDVSEVQWPVPSVGPNSEVYVAWVRYSPGAILFDRSTDGGQSFGTNIIIQEVSWGHGDINGMVRVISFPAMDVDITGGPYNGHIYVAYMDDSPGFTDTDIYFTRSTDGGTTWSQKVRINDDPLNNGCDQFHPWLTVAPDGSIIVVFLDRRLDPNNLLMDCYITTSIDGGDTWSPNKRITTVSSDPTAGSTLEDYTQVANPPMFFANRAGLLGEYIGVTASSINDIHPIWTDTRFGHQDVFVGVADTAGTYIQEYITQGINTPTIMLTPNPAHDAVTIRIDLSLQKTLSSELTLRIYNLAGRLIKEFVYPSFYSSRSWYFVWDGRDEFKKNSPAGVYFLTLKTRNYTTIEKLLLIR